MTHWGISRRAPTGRALKTPTESSARPRIRAGSGTGLEKALASLTIQAGQVINRDQDGLALVSRRSVSALMTNLPAYKLASRPFHWPLGFPEVFVRDATTRGFDAIADNPPTRVRFCTSMAGVACGRGPRFDCPGWNRITTLDQTAGRPVGQLRRPDFIRKKGAFPHIPASIRSSTHPL